MRIAENIKKLRFELCVSQSEFAKLLKVTSSSISHYESGKRSPNFSAMRKIILLAKSKNIKINLEDLHDEK